MTNLILGFASPWRHPGTNLVSERTVDFASSEGESVTQADCTLIEHTSRRADDDIHNQLSSNPMIAFRF
jgi:hypothetical protein